MVYLLTGPVRSGKTTALIRWAEKRDDVFGILTPDIEHIRFFADAHTKNTFRMEAGPGEEAVSVGRFLFSKKNFEIAGNIIRHGADAGGWLVIDEVGPLELREEGFAAALRQVLMRRTDKLLLVVREGLTDRVKKHFDLPAAVIITIDQLGSI